jgi:4'-phosphopantetheinyl transferase
MILQFSISHSDGIAVFALGLQDSIGVDIERIRALPEMMGIIERHFTVREKEAMLACPDDGQLDLFYRFWTRKEALLKALGEGLMKPLDSVEVIAHGDPSKPWQVLASGSSSGELFWMADLDAPAGFAGCVAAAGRMDTVNVHPSWIEIRSSLLRKV